MQLFVLLPLQGPKDLQVSLFQSLVLLLFNYNPTISFEDIKAQINIEVSNTIPNFVQSSGIFITYTFAGR